MGRKPLSPKPTFGEVIAWCTKHPNLRGMRIKGDHVIFVGRNGRTVMVQSGHNNVQPGVRFRKTIFDSMREAEFLEQE